MTRHDLAQSALQQVAADARAAARRRASRPRFANTSRSRPARPRSRSFSTWWAASRGALIRDGEAEFKALEKKKADLSKADIVKAIAAHPDPAAAADRGRGQARRHRPAAEAVLPLLK